MNRIVISNLPNAVPLVNIRNVGARGVNRVGPRIIQMIRQTGLLVFLLKDVRLYYSWNGSSNCYGNIRLTSYLRRAHSLSLCPRMSHPSVTLFFLKAHSRLTLTAAQFKHSKTKWKISLYKNCCLSIIQFFFFLFVNFRLRKKTSEQADRKLNSWVLQIPPDTVPIESDTQTSLLSQVVHCWVKITQDKCEIFFFQIWKLYKKIKLNFVFYNFIIGCSEKDCLKKAPEWRNKETRNN